MAAPQTPPPPPLPLKRYRILGRTGLRVSPLCLGTMSFGEVFQSWVGTSTEQEQEEVFSLYLQAGGNFIDTANNYNLGQTETLLGKWIAKRNIRDQLVIATKYTSFESHGAGNDGNTTGCHRKNLMLTVDGCLKRLQTSYIDLLYVHWWDHLSDVEEIMRALNDVVRSGKVLHIGVSDWPAWMVVKANAIADRYGWQKFACFQGRYALTDRTMEREIIPMCRSEGMICLTWGSVGGGKLTGKVKRGDGVSSLRGGFNKVTEKDYDIIDVVLDVAKQVKVSPTVVSYCYVQQTLPCLPIIGCRTPDQMRDTLIAANTYIPEDQMTRLREVSKIDLGFPLDFIGTDAATCMWLQFGGNPSISFVPWTSLPVTAEYASSPAAAAAAALAATPAEPKK